MQLNHTSIARIVLAVFISLACSLGAAAAKTILVIGPHPDDEAILASGIMQAAVARGDTVKVVVMTNGDLIMSGLMREAESVAAMGYLGIPSTNVMFLGYGDQAMVTLFKSPSPTTVYTSPAGKTATYGNQGLGLTDYHNYRFGSHGSYTRANVLKDLQDILTTYSPSDIYTTTGYDYHPDHAATHLFTVEAIQNVRKQIPSFTPKLHHGLVWWTDSNAWPGGYDPANPHFEPPNLNLTPLVWQDIESVTVPAGMQIVDQSQNQKYQTISKYTSQITSSCCFQWTKNNEIFWVQDIGANLGPLATATASSDTPAFGQTASKAIDSVVVGSTGVQSGEWVTSEWVTSGELAGAWIRLTWPSAVAIGSIVLHDRPDASENILSGTLTFSDGTSVPVGALPNNGAGLSVPVGQEIATWVQFRVDSAVGTDTGLAEIEVRPYIGPVPTLTSVAPASGPQGQAVAMSLTGTNFIPGATTVTVSPSGVTVSDITVVSSSLLTATFNVAGNAPAGARNVVVTTASGSSGNMPFTVTAVPPVLTSLAPASGRRSTSVPVTLTGSNFVSGATVAVSSTGVTASNVVVVSATQITATLTVSSTAAAGSRNVTVTTVGGTSAAAVFTVVTAAPTLSAVTPAVGAPGATVPVTLTGTNFIPGATVTVSSTGVTASNVTVLSATQMTATLTVASSATPGTRTITVTTSLGTTGSVVFTVPTPPTLTSIAPTSGVQGASVPVTLTGTNFVSGATVAISSTGVTVSNVSLVSATQITATLTIAATAALGARNVTVTTTGGTTAAAIFTVNAAAPSLTSITPSSAVQGSNVPVTLTGANFLSGATVAVSSTGVTVSNVTVVSATQITALFATAANAAPGARNVTVTTTAGTTGAAVFTVNAFVPPTDTNVAPASTVTVSSEAVGYDQLGIKAIDGVRDGSPGDYTKEWATVAQLAGAWIQLQWASPVTVSRIALYDRPNLTDNVLAGTLTFSDGSSLAVGQLPNDGSGLSMSFPGRTITWVRFLVTNATGDNIGLSEFEVFGNSSPAPGLTAIAPSSGVQGSSVPVTLTGTNFVAGAAVNVSSADVTVSNVTVVSPTQITATFTLAATPTPGARSVTVTTADGTTGAAVFTVNAAAPALTSIAPSSGLQGATVPVTLTGTNFVAGAAVNASSADVTVSNVTVVSTTQITATLTIDANAALGARSVTVTTAGGTTGAVTFTVNAAPPGLTAIAPSSGLQGATVPVTLTGANFIAGAAVNVSSADITVSNVTVVSTTQITATLTIATNATLGARNVTVTTAGGTTAAAVFTVNAAPPGLTAIAPPSGAQGSTVPVTLTGSNFVSGTTVAVSSTGVTASNVTVVSATQITATLTIDATATTGARNVTVTTAGGTTAAVVFTVNAAAPGLTAIAPSSGAQGSTVPVTLTGTNFAASATVAVSSADITVSNVTVVSATQVTATFAIAGNATLGARNVTVTTAGGTTDAVVFTVTTAAPALTAIAPSSGVQSASVPVTLTGANFLSGATVAVSSTGVTVSNVAVVSATQITATFTIAAAATTGARNVTVTTSAGTTGAVVFTVNAFVPPTETNVAPASTVTVSSETSAYGQLGIRAIDGVRDGFPGDYTKEWATLGQVAGSWIQLQWASPVTVSRIALYDRPNLIDNVLAGTLTFSDGSSLAVGQLPNDGSALSMSFSARTITWVRFLVTNAAGDNIGLSEFEVYSNGSTAPGLTAIAPSSGAQGAVVPVTLTGSNFAAGAAVNVSSADITVSNVTVVSATQITATLTIAPTATSGARNVTVTTSAGTTPAVVFTVNATAPGLTAIAPSSGAQGATVPVTLTGSNFIAGAAVNISSADITVSNVVVVSATQITATLTIAPTATSGARNVTVTTSAGTTPAVVFTVNAATPGLTAIAPSSGAQGATVPVTLTGTNFAAGAAVNVSSADITVSNVTVVSATQITATLTIDATATTGARNVTVTTAGGTTAAVVFTVNAAAAPTLTSIAPSSGVRGTSVPVTLTGTNFASGAAVTVSSTGVTVSNVIVASATQITATLTISATATTGARNVTVTTAGGTTAAVVFTVNAAAAPTLTSIAPSSGVRGTSVPVTLTGTNFLSGATVAVSSTGVTVSNVVVVSATQITATLTISATATTGTRNVTVTTTGGTTAAVVFTVKVAPPTLTSISPSSGGPLGASGTVTLTGTNFVTGATVNVSPSGITTSSVRVVNSTTITVTFSLASNTTLGDRNVTVTTSGGTSGPVVFTITAE